MKQGAHLVVVLVSALALCAQQTPAPPPVPAGTELAAENELGRLLNQERARVGVPELQLDPRLVEAARAHARLLAAHRHLDHQFPGEPVLRLRLAATGLRFDDAGENVAVDDDAITAHRDLLASVHHRENMLSPNYNVMGIGVAERDGQLYIAEDFAYRIREYSAAEAEDAVAAAYMAVHRGREGGAPQRVDVPLLREKACAMAEADRVTAGDPHGLAGARAMVSYNQGRPERLPPELSDRVRGGWVKAFAVGACFARTHDHPEGLYWIKVALY